MTDRPTDDLRARLTRRGLFGAGAAGGTLALTGLAAGTPDAGEPWLTGRIHQVADGRVFYLSSAGRPDRPVRVTLAAGADVRRDGEASLLEFQPGEEVAAGGSWGDGEFIATNLESTYRLVDAEVEARRGDVLSTADGEILFSAGTQPRAGSAPVSGEVTGEDPATVSPGDHVVVLGRRIPATGQLLAAVFGVRKES